MNLSLHEIKLLIEVLHSHFYKLLDAIQNGDSTNTEDAKICIDLMVKFKDLERRKISES